MLRERNVKFDDVKLGDKLSPAADEAVTCRVLEKNDNHILLALDSNPRLSSSYYKLEFDEILFDRLTPDPKPTPPTPFLKKEA